MEGFEAFFDCLFLDVHDAVAAQNHLFEGLGNVHNLVNRDTPFVAGVVTGGATLPLEEFGRRGRFGRNSVTDELVLNRGLFGFAAGAHRP